MRGNLTYQQRQQIRQQYLTKKQTLRKIFRMGKLVEKADLADENIAVIYGLLLEAKEKLRSRAADTIRTDWQKRGVQADCSE